jgi:predicted DNA-binding transcriptional regulator AlpA
MKDKEEQLLFTETEAQEMLSIGRTTLRKYRETKELVPIKLGKSVRYRKQDIENFIAMQYESLGK